MANRDDSNIPSYPVTDAGPLINDATICTKAKACDAIKSLSPGDLVMYTPSDALSMIGMPLNMSGFLPFKIKPIFSNKEQMWIIDKT